MPCRTRQRIKRLDQPGLGRVAGCELWEEHPLLQFSRQMSKPLNFWLHCWCRGPSTHRQRGWLRLASSRRPHSCMLFLAIQRDTEKLGPARVKGRLAKGLEAVRNGWDEAAKPGKGKTWGPQRCFQYQCLSCLVCEVGTENNIYLQEPLWRLEWVYIKWLEWSVTCSILNKY